MAIVFFEYYIVLYLQIVNSGELVSGEHTEILFSLNRSFIFESRKVLKLMQKNFHISRRMHSSVEESSGVLLVFDRVTNKIRGNILCKISMYATDLQQMYDQFGAIWNNI